MNVPGIVVDTNVFVSAVIKNFGAEAGILDLVAAGRLRLWVSEPILAEYKNVLQRPRLRLDARGVERLLQLGVEKGFLVICTTRAAGSPHEPDNRFLECAEAARADFLVTGNKKHFPENWKGTRVVNARELLNLLG